MQTIALRGFHGAVLGVALVVFAACGGTTSTKIETAKATPVHEGPAKIGDRMHDVEKPTRIPVAGAKVTLVAYFATWCHASQVWMPVLERMRQKYESKGLAIVGVAHYAEEKLPQVQEFATTHGATFPVVFDSDIGGNITRELPPLSWGQSIVIVDQEGVVRFTNLGTGDAAFARVDAAVAALVAK